MRWWFSRWLLLISISHYIIPTSNITWIVLKNIRVPRNGYYYKITYNILIFTLFPYKDSCLKSFKYNISLCPRIYFNISNFKCLPLFYRFRMEADIRRIGWKRTIWSSFRHYRCRTGYRRQTHVCLWGYLILYWSV